MYLSEFSQMHNKKLRRDIAVTLALASALLLLAVSSAWASPADAPTTQPAMVESVSRIGLTVSDADAEARFFIDILDFRKVAEREVMGREFEQLENVFGAHCRIVTLQLGQEQIELTEFLTPRGRPIPPDSRSNDRWFQHVAIITSDMDRAYALWWVLSQANTGLRRWSKHANP